MHRWPPPCIKYRYESETSSLQTDRKKGEERTDAWSHFYFAVRKRFDISVDTRGVKVDKSWAIPANDFNNYEVIKTSHFTVIDILVKGISCNHANFDLYVITTLITIHTVTEVKTNTTANKIFLFLSVRHTFSEIFNEAGISKARFHLRRYLSDHPKTFFSFPHWRVSPKLSRMIIMEKSHDEFL